MSAPAKRKGTARAMLVRPRLVDSAGAATYLSATERWLEDNRRAGLVPYIKLGRLVRYDLDQLDELIARSSRNGPAS